jgi:MoxR-like ATPase
LLEGLPGLGKTELVKGLSKLLKLGTKRVQFTPDLLPGDITGNPVLQEIEGRREFVFQPGPLFTNIVLADEINRASPKTQSALLEAMQEHKVTAAGHQYPLPLPFFVLATQNPIEQEGTYSLPEAQLDRFMFFITVTYPSLDEERRIARETTGAGGAKLNRLVDGEKVMAFQELVKRVPVPDHIYDYVVDLVRMTRPGDADAPEWIKKWVTWGAGPRAVQFLIKGAKARAVLQGSYLVRMEDVEAVTQPVLTHRIVTNFQAQSEGVTSDEIIRRLQEELRGEEKK